MIIAVVFSGLAGQVLAGFSDVVLALHTNGLRRLSVNVCCF